MKALNLKSMSWFMALTMMIIVSFTGCSDSDDNTNTTPVFPELKSISCNAGETKEFTFDANLDWKLTSTAIWCKFEKDGTDEVALSGSAGKQTVIIKVTDDDQKPGEASVAKLELAMGGEKAFVAEITRSALGYELKIYDAEGNEIQELELGYETYVPFKVKANFRFAASDFPEWVKLENDALVGVANKEVQGGLQIINNEEREKYPIVAADNNSITFSDEAGKASFSFPVYYKGMTPGKIEITKPSNNAYDWIVSLNGKTFTQGEVSIQEKMPFTIKTFKDEYEIVLMEKWNNGEIHVIEPNDKWMDYNKQKGAVNLTIEEFTLEQWGPTERAGYVIALSKDEYESIKDDLESALVEQKEDRSYDITYKYAQNNLLVAFTQKEVQSTEGQIFTVTNGQNPLESIECTLYEGDDANSLKTKYAVKDVFEVQAPTANINAKVSFTISSVTCYKLNGESEVTSGGVEQTNETEILVYAEAVGEDLFVVVKGESADDAAILIVRASNISEGGGENDGVFSVTYNYGLSSIECTVYNETDFGDSSWITDNVENCSDITAYYQIKSSEKSIDIKLNSANISSFVCRNPNTDSFEKINNEEDLTINEYVLNVWTGDPSTLTLPIFLIINGDDGSKYGLFVSNNQIQ